MSSLLRLCAVVGLLCGLFGVAAPARAEVRSADDCADQMSRIDVEGDSGMAAAGEPRVVEVVVPCAMVESGVLGTDCHDAAFYVVNTEGTLLCRIDVAVLVSSTTSDTLEDGPPASPVSSSPALMPAAAVAFTVPRIPAPAVVDIVAARGPPGLDGGRDVVGFTPRPS